MIIQHNMVSVISNRMLGISSSKKKNSAEKLSSGYRINRASDDAADLQISEKMRSQIRGLMQCDRNVQDGISLVQTADGALAEVEDILHRLKELTVQGLNDTNVSADRDSIQKEMNELIKEIDRIGTQTEFNGIKILQGFTKVTETTLPVKTEAYTIKSSVIYNSNPMPSWIDWDDKLLFNNNKVSGSTLQETDKVLIYEDNNGNLQKRENFTEQLDNNYSAVIDFGNLSNFTGSSIVTNPDGTTVNISNLYLALSELVESGFYSTCCTCANKYSILFVDDESLEASTYENVLRGGKIM